MSPSLILGFEHCKDQRAVGHRADQRRGPNARVSPGACFLALADVIVSNPAGSGAGPCPPFPAPASARSCDPETARLEHVLARPLRCPRSRPLQGVSPAAAA